MNLFTENELLALVAEGDQKAFTRLVDLHWNKVYSHALAYVKSSYRAQEITQDVFLCVWNKRHTLLEVQEFKNFLFVLGRNQIISSLRKKLIESSENDLTDIIADSLIPHQQLELKETYSKIMTAIESLPPTRKVVFKMSRFEGMTYQEISQKLNISINTVKEHIVLGLTSIKAHIHSKGELITLFLFILPYFL